MAAWKLGTFINGAIIQDNLPVSEDSITIKYNGDDTAEISIPFYAIADADRSNWNSYSKPYKHFITYIDDSNNVLYAGPIIKVDIDYGTEIIRIASGSFNSYLKKRRVSKASTTIPSTKTTWTTTGTALAQAKEILNKEWEVAASPNVMQLGTGTISSTSFSSVWNLSELTSIADALDTLSSAYDGVELKFTPILVSGAIKWRLDYGTASTGNAKYVNQALTPISINLDDENVIATGISSTEDGSESLFNKMWLQSKVDSKGVTDLKASTGTIPSGVPILENSNSFDVELTSAQLTAQMNAYLNDGKTATNDITLTVKADDKSYWVSNIGRRISIVGDSYRAVALRGNATNSYRMLEATFSTTKLEVSLTVQNLRTVRYPRLPRPKNIVDVVKKTPVTSGFGDGTTGNPFAGLDIPGVNFDNNELWGDVPRTSAEKGAPITAAYTGIMQDTPQYYVNSSQTVGVDCPLPQSIDVRDNGVVYGMSHLSATKWLTPTPMDAILGRFLSTPPSTLDTTLTTIPTIKIFSGQIKEDAVGMQSEWAQIGTVQAALVAVNLTNFGATRTIGGETWYIVNRTLTWNMKVVANNIVVNFRDQARYSKYSVTSAILDRKVYNYFNVIIPIMPDGSLGAQKATPHTAVWLFGSINANNDWNTAFDFQNLNGIYNITAPNSICRFGNYQVIVNPAITFTDYEESYQDRLFRDAELSNDYTTTFGGNWSTYLPAGTPNTFDGFLGHYNINYNGNLYSVPFQDPVGTHERIYMQRYTINETGNWTTRERILDMEVDSNRLLNPFIAICKGVIFYKRYTGGSSYIQGIYSRTINSDGTFGDEIYNPTSTPISASSRVFGYGSALHYWGSYTDGGGVIRLVLARRPITFTAIA